MALTPDMRRNLSELTKIINNFNKVIKKLSKMHSTKMKEGNDDKNLFNQLKKKQTMLDNAYSKYYHLIDELSPSEMVPVPLTPTSSASSSMTRSNSSHLGQPSDYNFDELHRRFDALQANMPSRRTRSRTRSRGGSQTRRKF